MRSNRSFVPPIVVASLVLLFASIAAAQSSPETDDPTLVKGFLLEGKRPNLILGELEHIRGLNSGLLKLSHEFENGDSIRSTASGRAEILLVPGCYLRLDRNTRISFLDLSPDNLKLRLLSGSAILEVATIVSQVTHDWWEPRRQLSYEPVSVLTPTAQYLVAGGGSYRFKVDDNGNSELSVLKGVAFVNGSRIDSEMTASVAGGRVVVTSGNKPQDDFDGWSRERGGALVKANHGLKKSDWYKKVGSNKGYLSVKDPEDASRARARLTVSAETGVVGLVEHALVLSAAEAPWRRLETSDRLNNGDRVRTAVESRAEIFAYPNCVLFLEGETEIVYRETDRQVAVEIIRGSAIVIMTPDAKAPEPPVLTIIADSAEYKLAEHGNYRINLTEGVKPELMVFEGTKRVARSEIPRSQTTRQDLLVKKMTGDSFDVWAYRRSRLLEVRGVRRHFGFGGMWYLVESTGEYTFVPAGVEYSSPYGGTYSIKFGDDGRLERRRRIPVQDPFPRLGRPDMRP